MNLEKREVLRHLVADERAPLVFHDKHNPPPPAYTVREAICLINAYRDARSRERGFCSCWWPEVRWRTDRGGCYNPDPSDKAYVLGQFTFVYPYNQRQRRRQMARKHGRRRAVRVPLFDWFWYEPHWPMCGKDQTWEPIVRAEEVRAMQRKGPTR